MPYIYCCNICFLTLDTNYLNNSSSLWEMASSKSFSPTTLSLFPPSLQHQDTLHLEVHLQFVPTISSPKLSHPPYPGWMGVKNSGMHIHVISCVLLCVLAEFLINMTKATSVFSSKTSAPMLQIWTHLTNCLSCV